MKSLFAIVAVAVFVISCSSLQTAKQDAETSTTALGRVAPSSDCEGVRSKIIALLGDRVSELETIGAPYLRRISNGAETVVYTYVHCPEAGAADTLASKYYKIGAGHGTDASPAFWYNFYIGKDLRTILAAENMDPPQPLDHLRSSEKWKSDWRGRR